MKTLVLHVNKVYFEAIRDGRKPFEYRKCTPYWEKRIRGRRYSWVEIHCGYPKSCDSQRILRRRWRGFTEETIIHDHFGNRPTPVFSIDVSEAA